MSRVSNLIGGIVCLIILILGSITVWLVISSMIHDWKDIKEYKSFCKARPLFCYCDLESCEYKTSYTNGVPSEDTKELCNLATRLKDKEMIFKSC